jgi:hypothetical protein
MKLHHEVRPSRERYYWFSVAGGKIPHANEVATAVEQARKVLEGQFEGD